MTTEKTLRGSAVNKAARLAHRLEINVDEIFTLIYGENWDEWTNDWTEVLDGYIKPWEEKYQHYVDTLPKLHQALKAALHEAVDKL